MNSEKLISLAKLVECELFDQLVGSVSACGSMDNRWWNSKDFNHLLRTSPPFFELPVIAKTNINGRWDNEDDYLF